jgi:hypothetical protein
VTHPSVVMHLMRDVTVEGGHRVFRTVCGHLIKVKLSEVPQEAGVTGWWSRTTCEECLR